jgi:hypothetical protein
LTPATCCFINAYFIGGKEQKSTIKRNAHNKETLTTRFLSQKCIPKYESHIFEPFV